MNTNPADDRRPDDGPDSAYLLARLGATAAGPHRALRTRLFLHLTAEGDGLLAVRAKVAVDDPRAESADQPPLDGAVMVVANPRDRRVGPHQVARPGLHGGVGFTRFKFDTRFRQRPLPVSVHGFFEPAPGSGLGPCYSPEVVEVTVR